MKTRRAGLVSAIAIIGLSLIAGVIPVAASGLLTQSPLVIIKDPGYGHTFVLNTSGGSGNGAVTFSYVQNSPNCILKGDVITLINWVGSCWIIATKASDSTYLPATSSPLDFEFIYISGPPRTPKHHHTPSA